MTSREGGFAPFGQTKKKGQVFTSIADYRGQLVVVKNSSKRKLSIDRAFMLLMKNVSFFSNFRVKEELFLR